MRRIALSLELLNQLEYHWFFGIRVISGNKKSIGKEVSELIENEDKKQALTQRVMSVLALSVLYRLLFWIFNSSYRKDYYLLSVSKSYEDYKEKWPTLTKADQEDARKKGWFYTRALILTADDFWFGNYIEVLIAKNTIQLSVNAKEEHTATLNSRVRETEETEESQFFPCPLQRLSSTESNKQDSNPDDILINVTQTASVALRVLGISVVAGGSIFLSQVVKAYKQQALKTHPDKNKSPNANEEFIAVNNAYQTLLEAVKRKLSHGATNDSKYGSFDERYQHVDKLFKEFQEDIERYTARANNYIKNANDLITDAKEYKTQVARYLDKEDRFIEESAAFFKLADNYFQKVNKAQQIQYITEENSKQEGFCDRQTSEIGVLNLDEEMANESSEVSFAYL